MLKVVQISRKICFIQIETIAVKLKKWNSSFPSFFQLCCEVKAKREGTGLGSRRQNYDDVVHRLSICSTSTDSEPLCSSSHSESIRHSPLPGFARNRDLSGDVGTDTNHSPCFQGDGLCEYITAGGQFTQNDHSKHELVDELRSRSTWQHHSVTGSKDAVEITELEAIFHGPPGPGVPQTNVSKDTEENVNVSSRESPLWSELSYGSNKKKNTTALNAVRFLNYFCIC